MSLTREDHIENMWKVFKLGVRYEFSGNEEIEKEAEILIEEIADEFDW